MGRGHGAGGMAQGAAAGGMAQGAGRRGHSAWSMAQSVDGKPRTEVRWRNTDFLKSEGGRRKVEKMKQKLNGMRKSEYGRRKSEEWRYTPVHGS
jgi:hypothetical protein